jgi:hypothetical protein
VWRHDDGDDVSGMNEIKVSSEDLTALRDARKTLAAQQRTERRLLVDLGRREVKKGSNPSRVHRESLKHKKCSPKVPAALDHLVYLPGVGSVADYEWDVEPTLLERAA